MSTVWSRPHTAVYQHEEIRVHYRFHPRAGEVISVFGRSTKGGEPFFILREVGTNSAAIPEWMTQPEAAALCVHAPPRLALDCLQALRRVLDGILWASDEDPLGSGQTNNEGP